MESRRNLQDLIREVGINPVIERQPCLPAPSQPSIVCSEEDHTQARQILVEQRKNNPHYQDPSKHLKRIFKSSKEKEKLQNPNLWEFSQEELDQALTSAVDKPATSPSLVQAFLNLGAKVNFVEIYDKKNKANKIPNASARRRSTVLQRAATTRRADSVSLLASSGADQTTLDEGLRAALNANDQPCVQELLRHGADLNKFPNALADAIRSNDQNFVLLLLRAPKALRTEIISSCLPAAVQQKSELMISSLVGHGADPNFDSASALNMAIARREYRLAVALAAGPTPLTPSSLHGLLDSAMKSPSAQELHRFLQLLFCCGLPPTNPRLAELLVAATKRNDTKMAHLLIVHGVSTDLNEAECLRNAIGHTNWRLTDEILGSSVSPAQASVALAVVPAETPRPERLHVITGLVSRGANGQSLQRWLVRAVEDGDSALMDLLLNADKSIGSGDSRPLQAAAARKDVRSLRTLLSSRPSSQSLAQVFPFISSGYTASERLEVVQLLLQHGATGTEVDQALVDAIADTSSQRDITLITELIRHGANVNHDNGRAISLAVAQSDLPILRLLCDVKPSIKVTSAALPLTMNANGNRGPNSLPMIELLLAYGVDEGPAEQTLLSAIQGGPENIDIIHRLITADSRLLGSAFQHTVSISKMQRKAPILKSLLAKGIPQDALDRALIVETGRVITSNDTTVLQLLIQHGASISYNDGEAFAIGVASGNSPLVKILLSGKAKPSPSATTRAFLALFYDYSTNHRVGKSRSCVEIARDLLTRGVDQHAIDSALCTVLDPVNREVEANKLVGLLLQHHADVNTADGICFTFAAKRDDFALFEQLLAYSPEFTRLVPKLVDSELTEASLVKLLGLCFKHGCTSDDLDTTSQHMKPTLVMALSKYPRGESLMRLLFTYGCNPNITVSETIDDSSGEEKMPALTWALAQPQKMISSSVILAMLDAGASPTRATSDSELAPIALAAREGRADIVQALLERGADPSIRDKWNRSALFYASSTSVASVVETLSAHALKNDGSLQEAARCLQLDVASILIKQGHNPNFPSRLHGGRNALGELCLNADATTASQRTKLRKIIHLFLENKANAKFKARNERSCIILALDNAHSALEVTEALLETEIWEDLNEEDHVFRDANGLWYSPLKYVELIASPSRAPVKQEFLDLLRDKGCLPKYYSETEQQPPGAIGMPAPIARLADREKEHQLRLKHAAEASEHTRMLEETAHRDTLRRQKEQTDASLTLASTSASHTQALEQKKHDFEMARVRTAEAMKRGEKATWHKLLQEQERDTATQRQEIEDRRASATVVYETRLIEKRKEEADYKAGVERRVLKEKEEVYDRNVKRQLQVTERVDKSAELHARLRQDRPAIEGHQWGTVD
ncbi:hypothetical protein P280DRAFT_59376 [Massarina eburnea CBS 473.64]|uniref:Ankyrin n=1 Tax=Massarina eburnea CBS 473.64 TaxID=1395130 RepID=A0A6A6RW12_9PLEO|nr:hypothetical protein P280DRAFT_59376 [Massarina eburnea CBS 473.64]